MQTPASRNTETSPHYELSTQELRQKFEAQEALSSIEASTRQAQYGPNQLPETSGQPLWKKILLQFNNVLIYVLLSAVVITALLGHWIDSGVILAVVLFQGIIGFIQESKAEQALSAIRHMLAPEATVIRDNHTQRIPASELVPGDTILLEAGDRVPADIRLERCHNLSIDESILTGESVAVDKQTKPLSGSLSLGDQTNMAFSGTLATRGTGRGLVVGIGQQTEIGRISDLLDNATQLKTPLLEQMDHFGRYLSLVIVSAGLAILLLGSFLSTLSFTELFMAVVGLTVASIPEGLPAILTITLAVGVRRMAQRKVVVRHMPVIETLGAVSVICSDKTGTLTRNEMMVSSVVLSNQSLSITGEGYGLEGELKGSVSKDVKRCLALSASLCNDAKISLRNGDSHIHGDPMEAALQVLTHKLEALPDELAEQWHRVDEIPFDAAHKYMATLNHNHQGEHYIWLKGAPESVLNLCTLELDEHGQAVAINKPYWQQQIDEQAKQGQRVLALACKPIDKSMTELQKTDIDNGLQLIALVGLIDPPRQEAIEAIASCKDAGIRVKMITGDHALTALAIAERLGLEHTEKSITGEQLDSISDEELEQLIDTVDVFARTSPEHKLRLVQAIQKRSGVVAMTGDGVNDAPALKTADVGIAMGQKGSAAAREASDIVLLDDNFASIAAAVLEGRTVYQNIKKSISFMLPVNGGEASSLIVALLFGLTLPITALQILWVNIVGSVILATTLAFESAEPNIMKHSPRSRHAPILSRFLVGRVLLVSALFLAGIFISWHWGMMYTGDTAYASTLAVNALVAMELFYLFAVRYLDSSAITLRGVLGTPIIWMAIAGVLVFQLLFTYTPWFQATFNTKSLDFLSLMVALSCGVAILIILECQKRWLPDIFSKTS